MGCYFYVLHALSENEWRVCIRVGGCAVVRLALWHRGGGCVRIWWSLLGGFCFLYVRCVHNEKSSAVSHVIKGIIKRGFLSVFLCTFISLCIYFFSRVMVLNLKSAIFIWILTDSKFVWFLTKLRGLYFEHRAAWQASTFCSAVVSCSVCGSEIQVWGQRGIPVRDDGSSRQTKCFSFMHISSVGVQEGF